jgi:hypothetical protein
MTILVFVMEIEEPFDVRHKIIKHDTIKTRNKILHKTESVRGFTWARPTRLERQRAST